MLCVGCKGSGNILTLKPTMQWWPCGICHGAGVMFMHGPAKIKVHKLKSKKSKK